MDFKKLEKEQLEAVTYGDGPLLIIAGAGTGKTTVITERIKYLILKKGVLPSEILALTFTEKAAEEMEERVDKVMPYGYTQMWISTFHSFCDRILRNEAIHIGLNPSYKVLSVGEAVLLLRSNLSKFNLNYFRPLGNPNKFLESIISHFSRLKDEDVSEEEYLKWAQRSRGAGSRFARQKTRPKDDRPLAENDEDAQKYLELANAYKIYGQLKQREGVMDFADLISNTLKLFRTRPNVLKEYQKQFKYILVDEFQDTNYSQNELAVLLAGERRNITVVGDDDQSIYRFRGSSVSNIIQFKKRFPKTKIVTLIKNFRSTKEILDRSYVLIKNNNPDRLEVKEKINKKLISKRAVMGEKVEFVYRQRVEDEGEAVANKIKILTSSKYQYKDIAILVRANDHSESFIRAFERFKIPYQFLGPGRLFHQEEIKNLIAYLKVLYNFEDSISLYRVLTMPILELEPIEIAALLSFAKRKNYTLFEAMEKANETHLSLSAIEKIEKIVKMIKRHLGLVPKETAGQILYYFIEDSGLLKKLINTKSEKEEKEAKNIAKFFDKLKTYEIDHREASVFEVVDWIELSMQMGESPIIANIDWTENDAVNILSIHLSKGLEFPVVFLVNLVSDRFPTRERKELIPIPPIFIKEILPMGDYHLQEERRLFYVGATRAKDYLFFTASAFYGEGKRQRKISPFIYEALGQNAVEEVLKRSSLNAKAQLNLMDWQPLTQEEKVVKQITPITFLSYSQIQTFDICPLHYKLKYILKIPTPQTSSQSFGTSIHATLRDFYQAYVKDRKLKIEDALKLLEKNWVNEGYQSKFDERRLFEGAKKILTNYLKNNLDKNKLPIALELPFQFTLGALKIGGRIDRIDTLENGRIEIIDYKTGNYVPKEKDLINDVQLNIYALAATKVADKILNKKPEDVLLSLYYLEKNQKLTTTRTQEQLENAVAAIIQKADVIAKSEFLCSGSSLCGYCEYKMICRSLGSL